jgi:hypothetical protein
MNIVEDRNIRKSGKKRKPRELECEKIYNEVLEPYGETLEKYIDSYTLWDNLELSPPHLSDIHGILDDIDLIVADRIETL